VTGLGLEGRLFDTYVVVDWSASARPSPKKPTKNAIWWAVARNGLVEEPRYERTRQDAMRSIHSLLLDERLRGRRVLVGFDFPFGYPAGVAKRLTGKASGLALWDWLGERVKDGPKNANNRFDVATEINAAYPGIGPCWGRPKSWDFPSIPTRGKARTTREREPPERRIADKRATGAKTVWQLAYAGSVGSQVLVGIPAVAQLRNDPDLDGEIVAWPFDGGLRLPDAPIVLAEVYPSLLKRAVEKFQLPDEVPDSAQVRVNVQAFARLDASAGLKPLFGGCDSLTDEERRIVESEEAWMLGLGHEAALHQAALQAPVEG